MLGITAETRKHPPGHGRDYYTGSSFCSKKQRQDCFHGFFEEIIWTRDNFTAQVIFIKEKNPLKKVSTVAFEGQSRSTVKLLKSHCNVSE
jgi:hypothetical protein